MWSNDAMRPAPGLLLGLVVASAVTAGACSEGQVLQPQQDAAAPAVPVAAAAALKKDMPLEVSVIGSVEAYSTVTVRAQITGELTAVKFQQGDDVQEGQELFTLDRRPLEAALLQASATLERDSATAANAKAILERQEQLARARHCRAGDARHGAHAGRRSRGNAVLRSRGD